MYVIYELALLLFTTKRINVMIKSKYECKDAE